MRKHTDASIRQQLTRVQKHILFALGYWYTEANRRLHEKDLAVFVSKKEFIEILMKSGLAGKKERALYRNLEALEKQRMVSYEHRSLALTTKGRKVFDKLYLDLLPEIRTIESLRGRPLAYTRAQTVFVRE